jgi:hypothetical protein
MCGTQVVNGIAHTIIKPIVKGCAWPQNLGALCPMGGASALRVCLDPQIPLVGVHITVRGPHIFARFIADENGGVLAQKQDPPMQKKGHHPGKGAYPVHLRSLRRESLRPDWVASGPRRPPAWHDLGPNSLWRLFRSEAVHLAPASLQVLVVKDKAVEDSHYKKCCRKKDDESKPWDGLRQPVGPDDHQQGATSIISAKARPCA